MNKDQLKKISKSMSYVLRHRPDTIGIELQEGGWISVDELLTAFERAGKPFTLDVLERVVTENDKQRFEFSADRLQIRARQGHSVEVDLGYAACAAQSSLSRHRDAKSRLDPQAGPYQRQSPSRSFVNEHRDDDSGCNAPREAGRAGR